MIYLYDNPFSPFTRKVRLVLAHKNVAYESIDGLADDQIGTLRETSARAEVPVLVDDGFTVVNSADIVYYLEDRFPSLPVLPSDLNLRVKARDLQRLADTTLDAIVHDLSIWAWPMLSRNDVPPLGLYEKGAKDIRKILTFLETGIGGGEFFCGDISIADYSLFPHISSLKLLGLSVDPLVYPRLSAWLKRMRALPFVAMDQELIMNRLKEGMAMGWKKYESEKIVWRGDRLEWLLGQGFGAWWMAESEQGRVIIPSAVPTAPLPSDFDH